MSTDGTKSRGAAADGKSGVFEVLNQINVYAAGCKKNALKVSKQSSVCTARCGDKFDIRSPSGMHNCIVVNSLFSLQCLNQCCISWSIWGCPRIDDWYRLYRTLIFSPLARLRRCNVQQNILSHSRDTRIIDERRLNTAVLVFLCQLNPIKTYYLAYQN